MNAASTMAATVAAAVADGRHQCETDYLVQRGAVFPAMGDADIAAFNAATLPGPGGDFHADERRERVRYRAVARMWYAQNRARQGKAYRPLPHRRVPDGLRMGEAERMAARSAFLAENLTAEGRAYARELARERRARWA